jgi:branched-chain amino acid transport system ATP-binding protein
MSDHVLEVRGLTAGYHGATVLRDISLTVSPGEIAALLGPNGAGKTTTVRAISRLIPTMSGEIRFDGRLDCTRTNPSALARAGIAHVPDGRGIFFGLTVAEHFALGPRRERIDAGEAYKYFPVLSELRKRRAGLLSGGEQQMLAVGRALVRHPKLLLLDELSLGLAPVIVEGLLPVIRRYATESGCGVLMVEQHVQLALEIADHAYVLTHGTMTLDASAATLREQPDLIVSSYLGESAAGLSDG